METTAVLEKLDHIENLPTLPSVAIEVNKMLQDMDTSIKDLNNVIEKDQAIVSKILRLVNSAFFGLPRKVSNLQHAITLLGFSTIRNAIISISIIDVFPNQDICPGFRISDFWMHSVAVAVTSRYMAEETRLHTTDESFIGGLLHDIGKVVLSLYFNDLFNKAYQAAVKNNYSFYQAERDVLQIDHARIGAHLAKKWKLPIGLADSIRFHHAVKDTAHDFNLLMLVHAANIIVNSHYMNPPVEINYSEISPDVLKVLEPQLKTVTEWFPAVTEQIESACRFFINKG